jgi:hypothetical protein
MRRKAERGAELRDHVLRVAVAHGRDDPGSSHRAASDQLIAQVAKSASGRKVPGAVQA